MAKKINAPTPLPVAPPTTEMTVVEDTGGAPSLLTAAPLPEAAALFLKEAKGPRAQPAKVPFVSISHGDGKFLLPSGELVDMIEGYPIYYFHVRRFYKRPPALGVGGKGLPPDCWSGDMVAPHRDSIEKQSEICSTCQWNDFGSARDGKSKACGTRTLLFLLNPRYGSPPLVVVDIPPSSLRVLIGNRFKGGFFSQATARHGCYEIVWSRFLLAPGGDLHHVLVPSMGPCASMEETKQLVELRNKFIALMDGLRGETPMQSAGDEE